MKKLNFTNILNIIKDIEKKENLKKLIAEKKKKEYIFIFDNSY